MAKRATTVEEQIELLISRGLTITETEKAKEILLDVGYYRLGFYLFPFEKTYPNLRNRSHEYIDGASFDDAVRLYYFDFDLRLLLMRYLNRIEIAFRTALVYQLSNEYGNSPIWFVNPSVVSRSYANDFEKMVYTADFKRNPIIHRHHQNNPNDRFAPAWKTLEFMTFGAVMKLYEQLRDSKDKIAIANKFGVRQVRNACAHGLLLYDMKLTRRIKRGPAKVTVLDSGNIIGALRVIKYIVGQISEKRATDMGDEVLSKYELLCSESPKLKPLIPDFSKI